MEGGIVDPPVSFRAPGLLLPHWIDAELAAILALPAVQEVGGDERGADNEHHDDPDGDEQTTGSSHGRHCEGEETM